MAPALNESMFAFAKLAMEWDVMRAITRIEKYRLDHGKYPASESELHSAMGGELPLDVFSGSPLRCRFDGDGLVIYSLGTNRIDEGGTPGKTDEEVQGWTSSTNARGATAGDWILWPPREVEWADGSDQPLKTRAAK
ncbi:MAG: hypothetical protein U0570_14665 [Phycisphaerales bacterium]